VFGAAVHPGGRASPTLQRRIDLAAEAAERFPTARLFLSGGVGIHPPSEAQVMAAALAGRVAAGRIVLDEESRDTLQSARAAARYARDNGLATAIACTDRYHQPRARLLLRMFGLPARGYWFARPRPKARARYLWKMRLREAAALPYDGIAGAWAAMRAAREARRNPRQPR
jgi:uncharacterized SAM-binding protein YcdF (DUF218 family)